MKSINARIITVSIPIVLGNLTQIILGIIDSAMVGSIDALLLAASSLVNNILAIPFIMGMGLSYAIAPMVASANGNGNYQRCMAIGFNGFFLCTIFALFVGIGIHAGSNIVFHLDQDIEVANASVDYLIIMGWSTVPMLMFLALKQFTDGLEYTRVAMTWALLSIPINTFLNWIFIFGKFGVPAYGLFGAGIGTLISRVIIFIALLTVILRSEKFLIYRQKLNRSLVISKKRIRNLLQIGIPSSIQYAMESGAFAVSGIMIGWFGATQQAAHQIAISVASLTFMVSMGLSAAGSILVGNAVGKKDLIHARTIGKNTLFMGLVYGVFCAVFFAITNAYIPLFFTGDIKVIEYAAALLIFAGIFQISDAIQAIDIGILRGLYDVKIPTIWVSIAYWVIGIPFGYYLAFYQGMESRGIWLGLVTGLSIVAITLTFRFFKVSRSKNVLVKA
ncbi:MATE family efflux transporter [Membranihabitans maritimus]|uniref:MATE family efflux transporter n=1 Tax=Membranihabitans maritimus TaxID=2904244 RepID=UPI001F3D74FA|nr:MATE family efflux transporter [Membranihabitans maritimus]